MINTYQNETIINNDVSVAQSGRKSPKFKLILVVIACAIIGTILTLLSSADQVMDTSTNPNSIIVQYSMPHVIMPVKTNGLQPASYPPFTLYGNGLMVCGHDTSMPFMSSMSMSMDSDTGAPTSKILSQEEIRKLISEIAATGYFNLKHEYYKLPIGSNQETLRVSLLSGDQYVMYYRDITPPQPYLATKNILQKYCSEASSPYQPEDITIRAVQDADPKNEQVVDSTQINQSAAPVLQRSINSASVAKSAQRTRAASRQPQNSTDIYKQVVTGEEAKVINDSVKASSKKYIRQNGAIYEVQTNPNLPKPSNPLKVDYTKIRAQQAQSGIKSKLGTLFNAKASAASLPTTRPVRFVILIPKDGGSTQGLAQANVLSDAIQLWYCQQTGGYCYQKQNVSVINGTQTASYYMTCHEPKPTSPTDPNTACWAADGRSIPLSSLISNVAAKDSGTVYRQDVDTIIVTSWPTNTLSFNECGRGFVGLPLGAVDYFAPQRGSQSSLICSAGSSTAHEMGHTFGLSHTWNGTLMDGTPYTQYGADCDIGSSYTPCTLDANQKNQLVANTSYFYKGNSSGFPAAGSAPSRLTVGQSLYKNQYIMSPSGTYMAVLQSDNNFVVYNYNMQPVWATYTQGTLANFITLQSDGNLVLYAGAKGIWWTSTMNYGSNYLTIQDDGNLVLYNIDNQPLWSSKTGLLPKPPPVRLYVGESLYKNQYLQSPNGRYKAVLQGDNNFVVYRDGTQPIWATYTQGTLANFIKLQSDGNLVLYAGAKGIWWTSTINYGSAFLIMQDDGNLVLYNTNYKALWSTKTGLLPKP